VSEREREIETETEKEIKKRETGEDTPENQR
jgi:hypothetical protein